MLQLMMSDKVEAKREKKRKNIVRPIANEECGESGNVGDYQSFLFRSYRMELAGLATDS